MTAARIGRAVSWMIGALLSFSVMAVSVRELAGTLSIFEVLAVRSGLGLAILLAIGFARPALLRSVTRQRIGLHLLRNTIHYASQYAWAVSLTLLPLATVFALEFTMPAWTVLLAALFLGERLSVSRIGVVVLGFAGVLVVVRPGIAAVAPATALILAAAFGFAITMVATKALTRGETTYAIVLWMNLVQLPMTLLGSDPAFVTRLGAGQIAPVIGIGIAGLSSHYCLSNAFRAGDAIVVVPFDFLRIPLIAVVGWWLYGEKLDLFVFLGAGLIIAGVLWNLHSESRPFRPPGSAANGTR
ncbi:DMT family transporter [Xanthobacteraceae bacterium Astr-EGSB]|uniref:DMT family transporter n=1 Tax=Astrobacterium formosum TaxID=3069710 RepID=UPI0027B3CB65|nr:DMT family transporter [Xanthobacteraceae bacterium Astr-EGSB]